MKREDYAQQNTARMEKILKTSVKEGLSDAEATARLRKNGKNRLVAEGKNPVAQLFGTTVKNGSLPLFLLCLLLSAPLLKIHAALSFCFYLCFLAVFLLLCVLRRRAMRKHANKILPQVSVLRGGRVIRLSPEKLVLGDVILLRRGDILYTHAHIATDEEMTVVCERDGEERAYTKHGGDCFDDSAEPFNTLRPGDLIQDGACRAFVTGKCDTVVDFNPTKSKTAENHGQMCKVTTRIAYAISFLILALGFVRAVSTKDYAFLAESLLLSSMLIATAAPAFYSVLFDLLFLYKNRSLERKKGGFFLSASEMERVSGVDHYVLSTRSMFPTSKYVARYFETATGKRVTEKMQGTSELALLSQALRATYEKCEMTLTEEAVLRFCAKYATETPLALYGRTSDERVTLASYRNREDGKKVSLVWGDAEVLLPDVMAVSEGGRVRAAEQRWRETFADSVRSLKKAGFRCILFAETTTRNVPNGMPSRFADMKFLGVFALRRASDEQALRTLERLKDDGKKVFFVHDGDNAEWLRQEIRFFDNVPILDGRSENFKEQLGMFVRDKRAAFCIGVGLSASQKAMVVSALLSTGGRVAAAGAGVDDYRMMCSATLAIAPLQNGDGAVPPITLEAASVRAREHVTSQVETVERSTKLLGAYAVLTAALCALLLGKCMIALAGALLGNIFLSASYFAVLGLSLDLLTFCCFVMVDVGRHRFGFTGLAWENRQNLTVFVGFLTGTLITAAIALYVAMTPSRFAFTAGSFVFVSFVMMLNAGLWRFSSSGRSAAALLLPIASVLLTAAVFLLGHFTEGRFGFYFYTEMLFWALFPVIALLGTGRLFEAYLKNKYQLNVGEDNE